MLIVFFILGFIICFAENKILESKIFKFIFLIWFVIMFIYTFFDFVFSFDNILIPLSIFFLLFLVIYFSYRIYLKNNVKEVYFYRDIPDKFTPLEVSYLINNSIDINKDFTAVFLKLINKGIISINNENSFNRLVLKNYDKITNLDEKYIVDWYFYPKHKKYSISELEDLIINNLFNKNIFSKKRRTPFGAYLVIIIAIPIFIYGILACYEIVDRNLFLSRSIFFYFLLMVLAVFNRINEKSKSFCLTKEGKIEYKKILSFYNFLNSFSNIKNVNLKENKLWEDYLVYAIVLNLNKSYINISSNFYENLNNINLEIELNSVLTDFFKSM